MSVLLLVMLMLMSPVFSLAYTCACAYAYALVTSVSVLRKATRTSWCTWWQLKAPQAIKGCARGGIESVWYI